MPLVAHIRELRTRLIYALSAWLASTLLVYMVAEQLFLFLARPLAEATHSETASQLIFTNLTEVFFTYLKISLLGGFFLALPVILFQFYRFLAPGLYASEKLAIGPYLWLGPMLFAAGAAFAYYVIFPLAWAFFLSFELPPAESGIAISLLPKVNEYLSLVLHIICAFGLAFQLPIILALLVQLGVLTAQKLANGRRYAIVLIFVVAAIITPPDVISQIGLAMPLLLLYEATILWARWHSKRKKNHA